MATRSQQAGDRVSSLLQGEQAEGVLGKALHVAVLGLALRWRASLGSFRSFLEPSYGPHGQAPPT